jgi:hypothetical protein
MPSVLSRASTFLQAPSLPPAPKLPIETGGPDTIDPGFVVPPRDGRDRLTQPIGTDSHKLQVRAGLTRLPLRQPLAAAAEETGFVGSENPKVGEAGFGVLAGQRGIAALFSGFNILSSSDKLQRYNQQLQSMLDADIAKFRVSVAAGNVQETDNVANRAKVSADFQEATQNWTEAKQAWDDANAKAAGQSGTSGTADPKGKAKEKEVPDPGEKPEWKQVDKETANLSNAYPRQETLILTKSNGQSGTFKYDMDKVAALAASKDPELAADALHARNILLTDHIANQLALKQRNRAIYDAARNTLGAAGAIVAAVASHGTTAAATVLTKHTALRTAGYAVSATASGNPGKALRNRKQLLREEKKQRIDSNALLRRDGFVDATKDGFTDPEIKGRDYGVAKRDASGAIVKGADGKEETVWTKADIPARTVPVDEMPKEAIDAARAALRDQATREINKRGEVGFLTKTSKIDESRVYVNKKDGRDDMAEHAYDIVKHLIGSDNPANIAGFREVLRASNDSGRQRDTLLAERIEKSPNLQTAYQLLRDMGGGKSESVQIIRRSMEHAIDNQMSKDSTTARLAGLENYDPAKAAKDVTKTIASWLKRR